MTFVHRGPMDPAVVFQVCVDIIEERDLMPWPRHCVNDVQLVDAIQIRHTSCTCAESNLQCSGALSLNLMITEDLWERVNLPSLRVLAFHSQAETRQSGERRPGWSRPGSGGGGIVEETGNNASDSCLPCSGAPRTSAPKAQGC